uniref:Uncharacterized protein n=1 Tax=Aegilops tauschii subsp. strangulata TaxID=200361 RepID=A0A453MVE8_AEGTS
QPKYSNQTRPPHHTVKVPMAPKVEKKSVPEKTPKGKKPTAEKKLVPEKTPKGKKPTAEKKSVPEKTPEGKKPTADKRPSAGKTASKEDGGKKGKKKSEKIVAYENVEEAEKVVFTRTLYYLRPFEQDKYGQVGSSRRNSDQEFFQPKREVGTVEMIKQACEAREAEKTELEKTIQCLKK